MKLTFYKNIWDNPKTLKRKSKIHPAYFEFPVGFIAKFEVGDLVKSPLENS